MLKEKINVLIIGAGEAGTLICDCIQKDKGTSFNVVGFLDDSKAKQNKNICGVMVLGTTADIKKVVELTQAKELIIAVPSARGDVIRKIVENSVGLKLVFKILPRLSEILALDTDNNYLQYVRRVQPEDLLGGEILKSDQGEIFQKLSEETVLITGAAGSIGSELSRQVAAYKAKKIIFFDWWENGMFALQNYIEEKFPDQDCDFVIGDVKDRKKVNAVLARYKPTTIFHAAAYKHVPLMEVNPVEAIKNNILGTKYVAEFAIKHGVKKFVLVSTDKAVNPTNIMGATKRAAEKVLHILSESQNTTSFCAVRFGNVINSNGSAIPYFEKQIEKGGPVTVTHKDINRFFMTIPEAVHLILQAWIMGENNDLFVLDMGEPIKIYDLARLLIILHGYVPEEEIKVDIVGLRPGEKLYEEILVKEEETFSTPIKKIFRTKNYMSFDQLVFLYNLSMIEDLIGEDVLCVDELKKRMRNLISTYRSTDEFVTTR